LWGTKDGTTKQKNMVLEIENTEKGLVLESKFNTSNKAHLARLTGKDPKYNFVRDFLNANQRGTKLHKVQPGDILEVSENTYSNKATNRTYFQVQANAPHLIKMDLTEVLHIFL